MNLQGVANPVTLLGAALARQLASTTAAAMDSKTLNLPADWTVSKAQHLNLSFTELRRLGQVELTVPLRRYTPEALRQAVLALQDERHPPWLRRRMAAERLRS